MPKPYIEEEECVRCGICVDMCPIEPKIVDWQNNDQNNIPIYASDTASIGKLNACMAENEKRETVDTDTYEYVGCNYRGYNA
jgi:ferredoxin